MNHDSVSKQIATSILRQYGIVRPTLDNIIFLIESYGYEVVDYDTNKVNRSISAPSVEQQLANSMAYTYSSGKSKIVFFDDRLAAEDKLLLAAHELGHICLDHLDKDGDYRPIEEYEANEFVHYLLHPSRITALMCLIKSYKRETVRIVICILLLLSGIFSGIWVADHQMYSNTYYICEHGTKYHLKDCRYIQGSTNSRRMTKEEFDSGMYEPCKVCRPDQ